MTTTEVKYISEKLQRMNPMLYAALHHHRNHRGKKLDLEKQPAMKAMYAETRPFGCVIKSVQGGVSEWLLVKGINDAIAGRNVFWVLPDGGLVGRFVNERFNKTLDFTPEYQAAIPPSQLYSTRVKVSMKKFGLGTIAFTGSRTPTGFTEFVADTMFIDEFDRCNQKNIAMASERLGFADNPHEWRISNPTIMGFGIDEEYAESTQGRWYIRCHHCGKYSHPDPFDVLFRQIDEHNYIIRDDDFDLEDPWSEPNLICPRCGKPMNRFAPGVWVEKYPKRRVAGYHFSRLFTSNTTLRTVVEDFSAGLKNHTKMMRVHNAHFGWAFDSPGAKITKDMIDSARRDYRMSVPGGACIFGADVGAVIHIVIGQLFPWSGGYGVKVVWAGEVMEEKDALEVYDRYKCIAGVIDSLPEERMTRRMVRQRRGLFRAYYNRGKVDSVEKERKIVNLVRTPALDAVKEGLVAGQIILPQDISSVDGFYDQLQAGTRIYEEDRDEYVWNEGSKADHYHHAMAYMNTTRALILSAM